jgi:hypothetical protein
MMMMMNSNYVVQATVKTRVNQAVHECSETTVESRLCKELSGLRGKRTHVYDV